MNIGMNAPYTLTRTRPVLLLLTALILATTVYAAENVPSRHNQQVLQFMVIGDWGMQGAPTQRHVAEQMDSLAAKNGIDFIVSTGDNFYPFGVRNVTDPLWQRNFEAVYSLPHIKDIPWYVTLGNHDYFGNFQAEIDYGKDHPNWILPTNYYVRDFKLGKDRSARFIFLDSSPYLRDYRQHPGLYHDIDRQDPDTETRWLKQQLDDDAPTWKLVFAHHPLYTSGAHGDITEIIQAWSGLFQRYHVNAYFAGHDHHLEHIRHSGTTNYFISGGGGARTRRVTMTHDSLFADSSHGFAHVILDQNCMQVRFIDDQGTELYRTVIPASPSVSCAADKQLMQ